MGTGESTGNNLSCLYIGSTGNNLHRFFLTHIQLADKKVIRIRMFFHRKDFSCDYSFDSFSRTDDMLYRDAVYCQCFRHIIRIHSFYIY